MLTALFVCLYIILAVAAVAAALVGLYAIAIVDALAFCTFFIILWVYRKK